MTSVPVGIDRWRQLVRDFERSRLTQRDFAEANGVTASALAYWRRRLMNETEPSPPSSALAVSFVEARPDVDERSARAARWGIVQDIEH